MGLVVRREAFAQFRESLDDSRIVFTNGCFDLLHAGHIHLFNVARSQGDALVVGINSDRSTRELKGSSRPIVQELDRANSVAAIPSVTFVIIYDELQALETIKAVRPHIYVKGGDYEVDEIPEVPLVKSLGGQVVLAPLVKGRSTTNILRQITHEDTAS